MKRKDKYDLKKLYLYVDHHYSNGCTVVECEMRYAAGRELVWKDNFKIPPNDAMHKSSWTDTEEIMIETLLEWLEEEVDDESN